VQKYMTVTEAAELLHVTPKALRLKVARRQVPFRRFGKLIRFSALELEKYMTALGGCDAEEALTRIVDSAA
jgi:excisionase family DNA binding protein